MALAMASRLSVRTSTSPEMSEAVRPLALPRVKPFSLIPLTVSPLRSVHVSFLVLHFSLPTFVFDSFYF